MLNIKDEFHDHQPPIDLKKSLDVYKFHFIRPWVLSATDIIETPAAELIAYLSPSKEYHHQLTSQ